MCIYIQFPRTSAQTSVSRSVSSLNETEIYWSRSFPWHLAHTNEQWLHLKELAASEEVSLGMFRGKVAALVIVFFYIASRTYVQLATVVCKVGDIYLHLNSINACLCFKQKEITRKKLGRARSPNYCLKNKTKTQYTGFGTFLFSMFFPQRKTCYV